MSAHPFPTMTRYLASIDGGYPALLGAADVKASVLRELRIPPRVMSAPELPREVVELAASTPAASAWIPEVLYHALTHALFDHEYGQARMIDYLEKTEQATRALLRGPLYAAAFQVKGAERYLRNLENRWTLFRRGTALRVLTVAERDAVVRVEHPRGLYSDLLRHVRASSLRVGLELAGAFATGATIEDVSATSWTIQFRYDT
ncbi:MAG: hypothetical protein U0271_44905 [Polyangiaceae bacterium]